MKVASLYNLLNTAVSAPAINAQHVDVNDKFAQTTDLSTEPYRSFMLARRSVREDVKVSNSKSKLLPMFWRKLRR